MVKAEEREEDVKRFIDSQAENAILELDDEKSRSYIKACYRKNHRLAENAKNYALEFPANIVKKSRGAIFTSEFKKLISRDILKVIT